MFKRTIQRLTVLGAVLLVGAGCQDLDVVNVNEPDRTRALEEPGDVESLIGGAFDVFYTGTTDTWQVNHNFSNYGSEMTTTNEWWATVPLTREPRNAFDNSPDIPNFTGPHGPRDLWAALNEVLSTAHDGLRAIRVDGVTFTEGEADVTPRAEAFAKFMQGWAWGYLAMIYDQVIVIPEDEALSNEINQQAVEALTPYNEAVNVALDALEEAIAIADQNGVTFPAQATSSLWFGTPDPMSTQDFIGLANTVAARILVLSARTPQEREQLDWNRVLDYTGSGLTSDFETVLQPGFRDNLLYDASQGVAAGFVCCYRLDYRLTGPSDVSGAYQDWINAPIGDRSRFDIVTPDRRITGAEPTDHGAYVRYRSHDFGFNPADGLYRFSAYQWGRHALRMGVDDNATAQNIGTAPMVTVDENNLLRAEALLHTDDPDGAADLINITRTREHTLPDEVTYAGLPEVTADGVPESENCVPRTDDGACGDLLTALRYERMLELAATDAVRGYADSRGFGILPDGSWLQQPVPGNELDLLVLPSYTFGGVGSEWGAVYDPATTD